MLLKEYLCSCDIAEASRCLADLEVPHFHHELVYEVNSPRGSSTVAFYEKQLLETLESMLEMIWTLVIKTKILKNKIIKTWT